MKKAYILFILLCFQGCDLKETNGVSSVIDIKIYDSKYVILNGEQLVFDQFETKFLEKYEEAFIELESDSVLVNFKVAKNIKMKRVIEITQIFRKYKGLKVNFSNSVIHR